jgi:hypothetical protein
VLNYEDLLLKKKLDKKNSGEDQVGIRLRLGFIILPTHTIYDEATI